MTGTLWRHRDFRLLSAAKTGGFLLISLAAGALGSRIGVRAVLWLAVIGGCSSGLWLLLSPLRRMPDLTLTARAGATG